MREPSMTSRFFRALLLPLLLTACASTPDTQDELTPEADESESALTAAGQAIVGAYTWWGRKTDNFSNSFVFLSDGTFIHDMPLNVVQVPGGPPPGREEGRWSVNASKKTLTLKLQSGPDAGTKQVYRYELGPAPPTPPGLVPMPASGSSSAPAAPAGQRILKITSISDNRVGRYRSIDSWCKGVPSVRDNDCRRENDHGVWTHAGTGAITCGLGNACQ